MVVSGFEWAVIGVVALLVLYGGSKKIPDLAKSLGRALGEFRKGKAEMEKELGAVKKEVNVAKK